MRSFRTFAALCVLTLYIASFVGCQTRNQGPMERAGERIDEISDNVRDGENPLKKKGAMEKAGEAVDDALTGDGK